MSSSENTICALATAVGGAVAILRISGTAALAIAERLWRGVTGRPLTAADHRRLLLGTLHAADGHVLDASCLAVFMPGPNSYTGENVVEFQLHGGAVAAKLALQTVIASGCRPADPGEFTRRAFLNGRMDLTQAEAVAEMVTAASESALNLANRQLSGELGNAVTRLREELTLLLSEVESRLDFPDEELEWIPPADLETRLKHCRDEVRTLSATRRDGEVLRDGVSLVIAGAPNVGKSSLLNRLLGRDRAIVSPIPGTTRDTIEADLVIRGIPIRLVDTAGAHDSDDAIEQSGIRRAQQAAISADVVLWLTDATRPGEAPWPQWSIRGALVQAANKSDLAAPPAGVLGISAATGEGIDALETALETAILGRSGGLSSGGSQVEVSARHAALLDECAAALDEALPLVPANAWELLAVPLRNARTALGRITGQDVASDILDTIFHRFCIGK